MIILNYLRKIKKIFYMSRDIYGRENDIKFLLISIFHVVSAILEILSIALILPVIDLILNNGELSFFKIDLSINELNINKLLFLIFFLYFMKSLVLFLINRFQLKVIFTISKSISNSLFKKYLSKNYVFFTKNNTATLLRNIFYETSKFSQSFLPTSIKLFSDFLITLFMMTLLMQFNFKITLFFLIFFIFLGGIYLFYIKDLLLKFGKERVVSDAKRIKFIQEGFGSFQLIRSFGLKRFFSKKHEIQNEISHRANYYEKLFLLLPRMLFELTIITFIIFTIYIFTNYFNDKTAIIIQLSVFGLVSIRLIPVFNSIVSSIQILRFNIIIVNSLHKNFMKTTSKDNLNGNIKSLKKDFCLKNISYKYPGTKKYILNKLNFIFKKGDMILISGASGSGKSTLLNIIMGILEIDIGIILINQKNIEKKENFKIKNLSYVPQNTFLLDDSIKNNIILNKPYDKKNFLKAIELSGLLEFYKKFDNKDIFLGDRGINISGGQKQRIAIARALYRKSDIIILDEPTSSLDKETRIKIYKSLKEINKKNNCTIIIVSHDYINNKITNHNYHLKNGKLKKIK
jgi:ATP-binding cassette, subfamily B, bacterial PglK